MNVFDMIMGAKMLGGSGGGGGNVAMVKRFMKITGTYQSRVAVDFGFKPDFLMVYPNESVSTKTGVMRWGISKKAAEALGTSGLNRQLSTNSTAGTSISTDITAYIDDPVSNIATTPICACDETGFTIGLGSFFSGYCYIIAMKLT